jgi:hypothetical protein
MTAFVIPNAIQITTRQAKYTFASFLSRDTTYDVIYNIWRLARPSDTASLPSSGSSGHAMQSVDQIVEGTIIGNGSGNGTGVVAPPKKTVCACSKNGEHYSETAMDIVIPGTPEKIHNLIFASGFMKDFMATNQKLMGEWQEQWYIRTNILNPFLT